MRIFERSKTFPREEQYSLTDQMRRSSRSVAANLAEACRCGYLAETDLSPLNEEYEIILRMIVSMRVNAKKWTL